MFEPRRLARVSFSVTNVDEGGSMKFLVEVAAVAGAYVAGTVSPAIGRKLKAFVAKEEAKVKAETKAVEAKFDAELKKL